jgi:hypothetical protein
MNNNGTNDEQVAFQNQKVVNEEQTKKERKET